MHRAELLVQMDREKASKVAEALRPEMQTEVSDTRLELVLEEKGLLLVLKAPDASSLRAALNSYSRLVSVAIEITK